MSVIVNIRDLYKTYFQQPYFIPKRKEGIKVVGGEAMSIVANEPDIYGHEIFLPVKLKFAGSEQEFKCATIRVTGKKSIVKTAVAQRKGTVKEQFSVGDYEFTIKGVLIGEGNNFPEEKMKFLVDCYESDQPVELYNAVSDFVLQKNTRVSVESIEFPEVEGKSIRHRPFVMVCESDFVDTLTVEGPKVESS